MGHAIPNRPIGFVNKTLKISFFLEHFHFYNLIWVLDQWRPEKWILLKEHNNCYWLDILKPCFTYFWVFLIRGFAVSDILLILILIFLLILNTKKFFYKKQGRSHYFSSTCVQNMS